MSDQRLFYSCISCAGARCIDEDHGLNLGTSRPCRLCENAVCVPVRVIEKREGVTVGLMPYYACKAGLGTFTSSFLTNHGIALENPFVRDFTKEVLEEGFTIGVGVGDVMDLAAWELRNSHANVVVECITYCQQCWETTQSGDINPRDDRKYLKVMNEHCYRASINAIAVEEKEDEENEDGDGEGEGGDGEMGEDEEGHHRKRTRS